MAKLIKNLLNSLKVDLVGGMIVELCNPIQFLCNPPIKVKK